MISPKAYSQVNYIINNISEDKKNKIPEQMLKLIEEKRDKDYDLKNVDIDRLELLEDAKNVLSVIYTDYIATEKERNIIKLKERSLYRKKEIEKIEKYQNKDIFKRKDINIDKSIKIYKKEQWYEIIIKKMKSMMKRIRRNNER